MIKINDKPIDIIEVYEASVTLNDRLYYFTINVSENCTEINWDNVTYSPEYPKLLEMEDEILKEFNKKMCKKL